MSPPSRIIRIGIVGCGEVAQTIHLPTLQLLSHLYKVTALCDVSEQSVQHCATKFQIARKFNSASELVRQDDIDLVVILSSDEYHASLAVEAADAGKHVLIEKPMAKTYEDADKIIDAQKRNQVVIMVGYMRRYAGAFTEGLKYIRKMDEIKYARVRDIIGPNRFFIPQSGTYPQRFSDFSQESLDDKSARALAIATAFLGPVRAKDTELVKTFNLLCGLGSHDLSVMREALGMPKRCIGARTTPDRRFITAIFEYDGGFCVTYETGIDDVGRFDAHLEVYSQKQTVKIEYDTPFIKGLPITLTLSENDSEGRFVQTVIRPTYKDAYTLEYEELYEAICHGKQIKTTAEDAKLDLRIFEMIIDVLSPNR